jgi:ABC-type Mn2+/Zn2+ transport system ATPase subunit
MPENASEALLSVAGLSVVRGGRAALQDVSFEAHAGELIAVVGPNGAGKSTLFGALLGLLPLARGSFQAPGGLAFVPQAAPRERAFPVTALEVALMGAYGRAGLWGRVGADERRHAVAALDLVGLDDADIPYEELSAGQRRRALVARALVQAGSVMLLDEPFSDVDIVSEHSITSVLDDQRSAGRAVVMATHDLGFAIHRATHALLLNKRAIAFGPPAEVLRSQTLAAAYGDRLILLGDGAGPVLDEGAHHQHGTDPLEGRLPGEIPREP